MKRKNIKISWIWTGHQTLWQREKMMPTGVSAAAMLPGLIGSNTEGLVMDAGKQMGCTYREGTRHLGTCTALIISRSKSPLPWKKYYLISQGCFPETQTEELPDKEQSGPCTLGWCTQQEYAETLRAQGKLSLPYNYLLKWASKQSCMFIRRNGPQPFPISPVYELCLTISQEI